MPEATEPATAREPRRLPSEEFELKELTLHGHRVAYRSAGSGPAIVLVHGITSTSATWERVMPYLAARFTVIAPDLLGHGQSAKPRGDYSLGAYASGVRDPMVTLGHESATFVGHSLGGGVVMQLAYQFPERCERLVLVDSGGLGREVSLLLRAATLPLSEVVLPLLASARLLDSGRAVGRVLGRLGLQAGTDIGELARGHASLADPEARAAFVHTLRTIVDPGGQRVNASDRLYLAENIPFMLVWGTATRSSRSSTELRRTSWCLPVASRSSRVRVTSRIWTTRSASSTCCSTSSSRPSQPTRMPKLGRTC